MHVRSFLLTLVLIALALLIASCGRPSSQPSDQPAQEPIAESVAEIVATMNGRPLYQSGLEREIQLVIAQYQQIYAQFGMDIREMLLGAAGAELGLNLELEALQRLAGREVLVEEAEKRGIVIGEAETDAKFREIFADYLASRGETEEEFGAYLESIGRELDAFVSDSKLSVYEQLIVEALQNDVAGPIELTEDDIVAFFEENRAEYEQEERVRASHILLETEEEAQAVLDELEGGADFAELARERSTCPSGPAGGDLDWFVRGQMVQPFEETAFGLEEGEMSGIVQTEFGFHIILKTGHQEQDSPALEEIIDQVRSDAEQAEAGGRFSQWFQETFDAANVTIQRPLLAAAKLRNEDPALGLDAFEQLLEDESVDHPFLEYLVGIVYEEKRQLALNEKAALEETGADDPETAVAIAELETVIEEATARAVALYKEALDRVGEEPAIRARLDILEPPETQTPSEAVP